MTTFHPSPFFFEELGISEKDCAKAFKQLKQSTSLLSPMTDFRALCVELTDCLEKADWPHRYKIVFQQWTDIARAALAEPADDEVAELAKWLRQRWPHMDHIPGSDYALGVRAADLLERLSPPQPVPVTERLPMPEDCIVNPRNGQGQWCWGWCVDDSAVPFSGRWRMMRCEWLVNEAKAWLPAHALPVPGEGEA